MRVSEWVSEWVCETINVIITTKEKEMLLIWSRHGWMCVCTYELSTILVLSTYKRTYIENIRRNYRGGLNVFLIFRSKVARCQIFSSIFLYWYDLSAVLDPKVLKKIPPKFTTIISNKNSYTTNWKKLTVWVCVFVVSLFFSWFCILPLEFCYCSMFHVCMCVCLLLFDFRYWYELKTNMFVYFGWIADVLWCFSFGLKMVPFVAKLL